MIEPAEKHERVVCYVDGFNLYHGLKQHSKTRAYRWLNLWSLTEDLLLPGQRLERVIFFTSLPPWSNAKRARHERYIAALESVGVEIVRGRFQKDESMCLADCGKLYVNYVEKLTDVHISTTILRDGVEGKFDWAYLISGDADQSPTIRTLRAMAPTRKVRVIFPPRRHATELEIVADSTAHLHPQVIKRNQLPQRIIVGARVIEKPDTW
ncbi:MAG: NYN domain-containing protein [Gemmatimonadaceae bacterium]